MEKIYSKVAKEQEDQDIIIHIINRLSDIKNRTDLSNPLEFLQIATLELKKDQTFFPHKHKWKSCDSKSIAQESWIIIKGSVKAILYDLDDSIIGEYILMPGDCSITFYGGHNYISLEEGTIVYEVKIGPYKGQELDKQKI